MSGHWADAYVGRPAVGSKPCWALVRQVWIDRLGFTMPAFESETEEEAVALGSSAFSEVPRGQEKELDAVMMKVPMRDRRSPAGLRHAETHIGVVVAPGLVLHVERERTAVIERLRDLKVSRILRGPWSEACT